uniref:Transmembrane protein 65 n=1 Tax=Timema cristinae TaxID=61476 RepID=A0A7R9GP31_TIMCR|nr:unnamed protein product [Timema cristinae]
MIRKTQQYSGSTRSFTRREIGHSVNISYSAVPRDSGGLQPYMSSRHCKACVLQGDYIEYSIGTVVVISTMAAAALGNTISDILGLGSAWYVERMAIRVGMKPPKLSPIQLDMPISRRFANLGRVLGVTIGCLLGMLPLLFLNKKLSNAEPHEDEE